MKRLTHHVCVAIVLCWVQMSAPQAMANERVFSEYQYDKVGNEISRSQDKSGSAPVVDSVSPSVVRQNQVVTVTVQGQGLRGAQLASAQDFFKFSEIQSTDTQLEFVLSVDEEATQGPAQISASTGLGTVFIGLNVLQKLPDLRVSPTPLVLAASQTTVLNVSLSAADAVDHDVAVSVSDASVISLSANQIRFDQGNLFPASEITITAQNEGVSSLRFASETLGDQTYTVRVSNDSYELVPGSNHAFNSDAVGVNKLFVPSPPDLSERGPFISEVRVNRLFTEPVAGNTTQVYSSTLGVLRGRYHEATNPTVVGAGQQNINVILLGRGLAATDSVALEPSQNTQISNVSVAATGDQITFDLSVDVGTSLSLRRLVLSDPEGVIPAVNSGDDRIYVGGVSPVIESVTPIYLNRGDVRTITVRGTGLESVQGIRFDNNQNVGFSQPVIAPDGRSLSFNLEVVGFATLGPRALTLESLLGDSAPIHSAANVIHFEDRPPNVLTPVVSAQVGVERQLSGSPNTRENMARSTPVGVSKGGVLTQVLPSSRSQGSNVSLQLEGAALDSVIAVEFQPDQGITVGSYSPNASGEAATLGIAIANDALPTVRRLRLLTSSGMLAAVAGADRFTVTLPRPEIQSVSPILVDRRAGNVAITIRGERLNGATQLKVIPSDGITASLPVTTIDGKSASASLVIAADAPLTPRVIQLITPGGETETAAMAFNTINLVDDIDRIVTPIVSPDVGVLRLQTPITEPPRDISSFSQIVGVLRPFTPASSSDTRAAYASQVGISKGPTALNISPTALPINTQMQTIEVMGRNLDNVTTVQTIPADGITLTGPATISADGTRVTFAATVAADADQTARRLELVTADGVVPFASPTNSQLWVVGMEPVINSISPIQQVRGANFTMTIRGINLTGVQSVQATPPGGIQFGTPVAANDGRSLTVPVVIDSLALAEQKLITVTTDTGTTALNAMPENTFIVISE